LLFKGFLLWDERYFIRSAGAKTIQRPDLRKMIIEVVLLNYSSKMKVFPSSLKRNFGNPDPALKREVLGSPGFTASFIG